MRRLSRREKRIRNARARNRRRHAGWLDRLWSFIAAAVIVYAAFEANEA
jgi:hypothetical protein